MEYIIEEEKRLLNTAYSKLELAQCAYNKEEEYKGAYYLLETQLLILRLYEELGIDSTKNLNDLIYNCNVDNYKIILGDWDKIINKEGVENE